MFMDTLFREDDARQSNEDIQYGQGDHDINVASNNNNNNNSNTNNSLLITSSPIPIEPLTESIIDKEIRNATLSTTKVSSTSSSSSSLNPTRTEKTSSSSTDSTTFATDGVLPSYRRLIVFTATTILIWLSEPLLSLVDTTIVGLTSPAKTAVAQIAALGPATTLYDSAIYMTYFLAIATTNQLAPRLARKDYKGLRQSTSHLMGLAVLFGTIVTAMTFGLGRTIISQMVGSSITDASIVPLAANYAKIRAAVAPLCVVDFVAQSFCLTILDTKTPAMAVAVASLVNIVGDLILSPLFGIQGAALATAMATTTSCLILVRKVRKVLAEWKRKQQVQQAKEDFFQQSSTLADIDLFTVDNSSNTETVPFFSLPNKTAMIDLLKLAGPIFFVMMSKIASYSVLTVRATSFGVLPLATHNIMMRVFFFFACFGDSLSQAAQTFYPQVSKNMRRKFLKRLFYLATAIGLSNLQFSQLILKQFGCFLTKNSSIIQMMGQYSPFVGLAVLLHPFIMFLEGTVLAKRDLVFMVVMYVATGLMHFGHVFSPAAASFMGLWRALFVFQFIRLVQFGLRVWDTTRRERNSFEATSSTKAVAATVTEL
ncbi:MATE efflux family protein [Nitzschia inconspicua]|uniref:MATE efflux family protein n=1 Tax=Nitzschia inconspicua TaxID=303405 RepID=A0A9K3KTX2_9STRA|nr:MATE efflux family protein [Nitzschia inconspicua]